MYKVLIVDDELIARIGLKKTINWAQYGFEVAADADNATTAMELCRKLRPDVVITDICMEPISGLKLIENLQKENLFPEIIVISGYSDFAYAQTAIKFGVSTYILKPVEDEDLTDALEKLKEKLDKKRKTSRALAEYSSIQREAYLAELLTAGQEIQNIYARICKEGFRFPEERRYMTAVMRILSPELEPVEFQRLISILNKTAKNHLDSDNCTAMYTTLKNGLVVLILFHAQKEAAEQMVYRIAEDFSAKNSISVKIGTSDIADGIFLLPQTFIEASAALKSKPQLVQGGSFSQKPINCAFSSFCQEKTRELAEAIILRKQNQVSCLLEAFSWKIREIKPENIDTVKDAVANMTDNIFSQYLKTPEQMRAVFQRTVQPAKEIWIMDSTDDIMQWLSNIVETLMNCCLIENYSAFSPLVQSVIAYITKNYAENYDIEEVARHFFVSSGHLMRRFKQETGKTLLEHLTEYRISLATTLLESKRYKIYEVGEMVGYPNTKYFRKIFQKITGKSPKDYVS